MLRDIRLWGTLGDRFGHHHRLAVSTPAEALRAIDANRPGFLAYIGNLHDDGIVFACFIGDRNIKGEELGTALGAESFEIAPIIRGAGDNGGLAIILGVILIGASIFLGPAVGLFATQIVTNAGTVTLGTVLTSGQAMFLGLAGASLLVNGLSTMLTPRSKLDVSGDEKDKSRPSTFFGGAVNTVAQGQPVPVLLGKAYVGSATVSLGIRNQDRPKEDVATPTP